MNFFKTFLASFLALTAFSVLSFLLMAGILAVLSSGEGVIVKPKSVLELNLDAQITEQQTDNPFEGLGGGNQPTNIGLIQLKETINRAAADPNIEGILLTAGYPMTGFATIEEIRMSLKQFRQSGKWVVAYSEVMSEPAYYLATAADEIYLNPEGELEFNGLTAEVSFFKRMFDKLEIKPEIFRVGEYKSAVEPFMLDKMSAENRKQLQELVNAVYGVVIQRIAEARNMQPEQLWEISNKMLVRNAKLALQHGLVDSLAYYDGVLAGLRNRLKLRDDEKVNFISYRKYRKSKDETEKKVSSNEIAVVVADGTIVPGKSGNGIIGSDTFTEILRKVRESKRVKAVVLRINSPGGSFQASDVMWREISLTAQQKPVIASMSDYAASGGYYLAMACDTILAQPHTITGSIGIFSVLFDASGFLNNKLGITFDEVRTGEFGELVTFTRPLTDAEKQVWQNRTNEIYEVFTGKAAAGRNLPVDEIKKVAGGRVWSGEQAMANKLVDAMGGLDDAIRIAAETAGVGADYRIRYYPKVKTFAEQLLESIGGEAETRQLKRELGAWYPLYVQLKNARNLHGVQARMPFEFTLR
ncbi:MAG: signal peptide peptidase SppA [Cyclobacteriaceae bacterium]|nr:MAG: signal peptide peptidase SppA [Cyclobacteriaceae bacterium]